MAVMELVVTPFKVRICVEHFRSSTKKENIQSEIYSLNLLYTNVCYPLHSTGLPIVSIQHRTGYINEHFKGKEK
jgi:hypothetical protein